jgi:tetratricopeptide (TPR) repeat protein
MHERKAITIVSRYRRFGAGLCLLLLLQSGCAAVRPKPEVPEPTPPPQPSVYQPPQEDKALTGPATGIYTEAEAALQAGRYSTAEVLLERALRIEPQNPHYWYSLSMAKYRQGRFSQAVQFCLKAESLAASQPALLLRARDLLSLARKAAGMQ